MIVPEIREAQVASDGSLLARFGLLGDVVIDGAAVDSGAFSAADCLVRLSENCSVDEAIGHLDKGAKQVIIRLSNGSVSLPDWVSELPAERLLVALPLGAAQSAVESIAPFVSGLVLTVEETQAVDAVAAVRQYNPKGRILITPTNISRQLIISLIPKLQTLSADVIVPTTEISFEQTETEKINLGEALFSTLQSDRPDGLLTTIVTDENRVALGLCYSSKESIIEALRSGTGVYQSRKRGLWYKGQSSGATQTLLKISVDCDSDALCFMVKQADPGFCHLNTRTCFGPDSGLTALTATLRQRLQSAPVGSYTRRLYEDRALLNSKIMEEAEELCEATSKEHIAAEAADLLYFALTKCTANGVSLSDIEAVLDARMRKVTRRPGNAKPKWVNAPGNTESKKSNPDSTPPPTTSTAPAAKKDIKMRSYRLDEIDSQKQVELLLRPIIKTDEIMARVQPIMKEVRQRGDQALLDLTEKFDRVTLTSSVIKAPFPQELMQISDNVRQAIDQAFHNIHAFHDAQLDRSTLSVETMPGVVCSRFFRPIERVGLYVPGGTAVLPSSTLMLGIPAMVAGCSEIVIATPPKKDGTVAPEVMYVAHKVGASTVLVAGGAQAVAAMAYGTETVPKVDKICGPGNQYVTAAKMIAQSDSTAMVSIDMPAGPSELLVIADHTSNPAYVASDLLSQAEHGTDSQVVLVAVNLTPAALTAIENEVRNQGEVLPRSDIVREAISKSYTLEVRTMEEAMDFSNRYAPEHLILHMENAERWVEKVQNAGSVFVGPYSPESCGDYASGTNHTLPTYGYARMYSGVNTLTFVKHITSQTLTREGLNLLGDTVTTLAEIEGLEAHRNAVAIRLKDIRASQ
ncbi:histidine biosynthesis trifunctional-protein [Phlyctochytrium arcticum]|nr:histidine biosynthesis trifunctional-protein [Phlyctochytrium arcticum]